jgi:3-isopropylmalate/(R)-2-methylmalate dehydratase large subunit
MGMTLVEKILSDKVGQPVAAGDYIVVGVDKMYVHEGSGPLAIKNFKEITGERLKFPDRTFVFLDHSAPSPQAAISNVQKSLREFSKQTGCTLFDINAGICHQIMAADWINPGDIVIGGDSHTCTGGALCAFATGMGSTDLGVILATGQTWLNVPETMKFEICGRFQPGVFSKDLILHIIGMIGSDGATYRSMEFVGEALDQMAIFERLTVSNMAIEAGAKIGLFSSDTHTRQFLNERGRGAHWKDIHPDEEAVYVAEYRIDLDRLEPTVSCPHLVDHTCVVSDPKLSDVKIDQAFLGSCTNARLEDLRIAADVIQKAGGKIHPDVRLIVNPASREIYQSAMAEGLLMVLNQAGAVINSPGCGVCAGGHQGVLADGEVAIGSNNRNFKGRFGNATAFVYLGSPATVAVSAVRGKITDPREILS